MVTQTRGDETRSPKTPPKKAHAAAGRERGGLSKLARFIREVVAELRKVIWPTRKELITYTVVVIVFVAFIMAYVAGLDFGFARAALAVFGGGE